MKAKIMNTRPRAIALAALYICESLLLELEEKKIVLGKDVEGLLTDAARALRGSRGGENDLDGAAAGEMIETIIEQLQCSRIPNNGN